MFVLYILDSVLKLSLKLLSWASLTFIAHRIIRVIRGVEPSHT